MVMIGDLPDPPGGVAHVCASVCDELAKRGVAVHFLDTEPNATKHLPQLASYDLATRDRMRSVRLLLMQPVVLWHFVALARSVTRSLGFRGVISTLSIAA